VACINFGSNVSSLRGALQTVTDPGKAQVTAKITIHVVERTITVQPGESIQIAIDRAREGAVLYLASGTWEENIEINKSLTLQGAGQDETVIKGKEEGYPVVRIMSLEDVVQAVSVEIEELAITGARGLFCVDGDKGICPDGVLVQGTARAEITNSTISDSMGGIALRDSAWAKITESVISGNMGGIRLDDLARGEINNSTISDNVGGGLTLRDLID